MCVCVVFFFTFCVWLFVAYCSPVVAGGTPLWTSLTKPVACRRSNARNNELYDYEAGHESEMRCAHCSADISTCTKLAFLFECAADRRCCLPALFTKETEVVIVVRKGKTQLYEIDGWQWLGSFKSISVKDFCIPLCWIKEAAAFCCITTHGCLVLWSLTGKIYTLICLPSKQARGFWLKDCIPVYKNLRLFLGGTNR